MKVIYVNFKTKKVIKTETTQHPVTIQDNLLTNFSLFLKKQVGN